MGPCSNLAGWKILGVSSARDAILLYGMIFVLGSARLGAAWLTRLGFASQSGRFAYARRMLVEKVASRLEVTALYFGHVRITQTRRLLESAVC